MPLPHPTFYDPAHAGNVFIERAALVAEEAVAYRQRHHIKPAGHDAFRIAAFGIDCQVGFVHREASLAVPGAVDDMRRTLDWLYRNLNILTGLHFSMDTHRVFQIFHPCWWTDKHGRPPTPFTPISHADLKAGVYRPISHPKECFEYTKRLEATGKYVLTIWPYHALLGGVSHALIPALMEAAIFHALVRNRQTHFETKGTHAMTESYSVLSPEVTELGGQAVGSFNAPFFKMLMEYDRIYIFGQAKSHCVLSTLRDIQGHIQTNDPGLADKIYILEDATSPVPPPAIDPLPPELDFPAVADRAFADLKASGMHIVKTSDAIAGF